MREDLLSPGNRPGVTGMKRIAIVAAAVLVPGSAQAEMPSPQQIFCAELKRVVEVAELGGDFAYLERSRAAPPRLGFAQGCQATGDERKQYWVCGQTFAPEEMDRDHLAARVAACLPEAVGGPRGLFHDALFTLPYARIHISELGGPGAHVGRIVDLVVEAMGAP
jgi:hypothetical protein